MSDLRTALSVAFRHIDDVSTTDGEREAVLAAIASHMASAEAELAAQQLFHLREQRRLQLTLRAILDGVGKSQS